MADEFIPKVRKIPDTNNCIECDSSSLRLYIGDFDGCECHHCNTCGATFGHCKFCDKTVLIDDYTKLTGVSNAIDVDSILKEYNECKVIENSLLIPDNIWSRLDLKDAGTTIARSGTWSSYCMECENELLVSIWFF
jgi:hypothetical protein